MIDRQEKTACCKKNLSVILVILVVYYKVYHWLSRNWIRRIPKEKKKGETTSEATYVATKKRTRLFILRGRKVEWGITQVRNAGAMKRTERTWGVEKISRKIFQPVQGMLILREGGGEDPYADRGWQSRKAESVRVQKRPQFYNRCSQHQSQEDS